VPNHASLPVMRFEKESPPLKSSSLQLVLVAGEASPERGEISQPLADELGDHTRWRLAVIDRATLRRSGGSSSTGTHDAVRIAELQRGPGGKS
jgi:hypothetical protein